MNSSGVLSAAQMAVSKEYGIAVPVNQSMITMKFNEKGAALTFV
jgi:hypothetical protein